MDLEHAGWILAHKTNAQAWKQIQNGVGNRINNHIKKLLTEEKMAQESLTWKIFYIPPLQISFIYWKHESITM